MNDKEKRLKKIFKQIEKYNDGKHDNKIIELCDEGLNTDNKNIQLYLFKCNSLKRLEKYHNNKNYCFQIIENYTKVIELSNNNYTLFEAYFNRGANYNFIEKYNKAIEDFNKAIEINPNYCVTYYNRGISYFKLGYYEKSVEDFSKTIKIFSDYYIAYYNRG
ncbi:tetratricopeptide repeat protein, partial [Brachyspira hampsonii]